MRKSNSELTVSGRIRRHRRRSLSLLVCLALITNLTPAAAKAAAANELLDWDITQLMNITVTSVAKKEQHLADAAAAVFVISQEDIRRSGVTTLPDALAMAPGLQVAKSSAATWSINARGFGGYTSNKLLVLMDGRSLYSPAYSGTFWDAQNMLLEDIERIEVIRGPGATMWGANAVNGVINIITKKAKDTQGGLVRFGAGNEEKIMAAGRYGAKLSDSTYGRMYLTYNDHGSNELSQSGLDAHDSWRPAQGGFRLDGSPGSSGEWTVQGDLYKNDKDATTFPYWDMQRATLTRKTSNGTVGGGNLLGRWHQELAPGQELSLQAYYDRTSREEEYFQMWFDTFDVDLQYETPLGQRQKITLGAGYRYIKSEFDETGLLSLPDREDGLFSAFAQDEISLVGDVLWLIAGSKYEHNEYSHSEWQPSAKLLWKPVVDHSFWASAARAVRTPTALDQEGRVTIGLFNSGYGIGRLALTGNSGFESETVFAYEAGTRWQVCQTLSFDLSLFYNQYDKLYTVNPAVSSYGYDLVFINGMKGDSYGAELVANWKAASWLSLTFTYSYLEMDLTLDDPAGISALKEYLVDSSPRHQASLRSSFMLADDWQLNLWLRYVDAITCRDSTNLVQATIDIDRYFLVDANIIWTPMKNLEVLLAAQNMLDNSQLQFASEVIVPPTEIERGVYGKITYRF